MKYIAYTDWLLGTSFLCVGDTKEAVQEYIKKHGDPNYTYKIKEVKSI